MRTVKDGTVYKLDIPIGSDGWFDWLDTAMSFKYVSVAGNICIFHKVGYGWIATQRNLAQGKISQVFRSGICQQSKLSLEALEKMCLEVNLVAGNIHRPTTNLTGVNKEQSSSNFNHELIQKINQRFDDLESALRLLLDRSESTKDEELDRYKQVVVFDGRVVGTTVDVDSYKWKQLLFEMNQFYCILERGKFYVHKENACWKALKRINGKTYKKHIGATVTQKDLEDCWLYFKGVEANYPQS